MTEHYPLPQHAAYIWDNGQSIMIGFPPLPGQTKGHSIAIALERCEVHLTDGGSVPASQSGFALLLRLLRERASVDFTGRIGSQGEQTQDQCDRAMRKHIAALSGARAEELRVERAEALAMLEEIGL